jgi:hypothetical protein
VEKPGTTIKVYRRRNASGETTSWFARVKIPETSMWSDVRKDEPRDYFGSIYPTKDAAVEAAKAEIIRRMPPRPRPSRQVR